MKLINSYQNLPVQEIATINQRLLQKRVGSLFLLETVESTIVSLVNRNEQQQFHHYQTIRMIHRLGNDNSAVERKII
jgi:hypothetical protein